MSVPVCPPMPAVLSRVAAAEQFGAGSELHRLASRFDPPPPPTPAEQAEIDRLRAAATLANERWRQSVNLQEAFVVLGQCIELVDAHARALSETDASSLLTLDEWGARTFASIAVLFGRTPELLPIGPDVHANCGDDDR